MISILTPTYNRAHTLLRLFKSLELQDDQRFEWVLIDDGSTDGTSELLHDLIQRSHLSIKVITQLNAGKPSAVNAGVAMAKGDWVFIVDSDDVLTPDAIGSVNNAIEVTEADSLSGLCFRKAHLDNRLVGEDVTLLCGEMSYMHPAHAGDLYKGDLAYVFKKKSLLDHPFPSFKNEKFVPELLVWNAIGDEGRIAYFHRKIVYLCEFLPDGYTANFKANLKRNPMGFKVFYKQQFFRVSSPIGKLKCFIRILQCVCFSFINSVRK